MELQTATSVDEQISGDDEQTRHIHCTLHAVEGLLVWEIGSMVVEWGEEKGDQ